MHSLIHMSIYNRVQWSALAQLPMNLIIWFLIARVLHSGSTPTFNPKLGTSKGGTRLKVQVSGHLDFLLEHFLKINSGDPIVAAHVVAFKKDTVEAEFLMPALVSKKKSVVKLSYSQYGDDYINLGEFVYYGRCLTTTLEAQRMSDLNKLYFISCRYHVGRVTSLVQPFCPKSSWGLLWMFLLNNLYLTVSPVQRPAFRKVWVAL